MIEAQVQQRVGQHVVVEGWAGWIAELLESIDSKLDKVNDASIPSDNMPELKNVKDLDFIDSWLTLKKEPVLNGTLGPKDDWIDIHEVRAMIPGYPKMNLVRSWIYVPGIPHYRTGKMLIFRRQEIEEWIEWQQKHGTGDYWTKKRKYKEEE